MIEVGIVGYGTIGKRVADAVAAQPDMRVSGISKASVDATAGIATQRGYPVYSIDSEGFDQFSAAGLHPAGQLEDLVTTSDVIVDATPAGIGERNLQEYYSGETPAIIQGAESNEIVDASFCARANFDACRGLHSLRVVSCNTTALARLLSPISERYGIEDVHVTIIRRGGDPAQSDRGPINDIIPDAEGVPSHHGPDVQTVLPDLDISTVALRIPTTLMHVQSIQISTTTVPRQREVRDLLSREGRVFIIPAGQSLDSIASLVEFAKDRGRPRGDIWESCVWGASITVEGSSLSLMQAVHQESNVVPENIDAIRALTDSLSATESMDVTNEYLGIGDLKQRSTSFATTANPSD